jgi:hypothetical protein
LGGWLFFFQLQTQRERRTGESKPMLLLSTKEITIGNSVVKLYSIDGGKI